MDMAAILLFSFGVFVGVVVGNRLTASRMGSMLHRMKILLDDAWERFYRLRPHEVGRPYAVWLGNRGGGLDREWSDEAAANTAWNALDTLRRVLCEEPDSRVFCVLTPSGTKQYVLARDRQVADRWAHVNEFGPVVWEID